MNQPESSAEYLANKPPSLLSKFVDMLKSTGRYPVGSPTELMHMEQQLQGHLDKIAFPIERLPEIETWLRDSDEAKKPITRVNTILQEMQRRLAQGVTVEAKDMTAEERDAHIDQVEREQWERVANVDRDSLPAHGQLRYDYLKERYG